MTQVARRFAVIEIASATDAEAVLHDEEIASCEGVFAIDEQLRTLPQAKVLLDDLTIGISQCLETFGDWSTRFMKAIRIGGVAPGYPICELYRRVCQDILTRRLGLTFLLGSMELDRVVRPGDTVRVYAPGQELFVALRAVLGRRGVAVEQRSLRGSRTCTVMPSNAPQTVRSASKPSRLRHAIEWRLALLQEQRTARRLAALSSRMRSRRKRSAIFYVQFEVDLMILRRTADMLHRDGFNVLFVDYGIDAKLSVSGVRTDHPMVRLRDYFPQDEIPLPAESLSIELPDPAEEWSLVVGDLSCEILDTCRRVVMDGRQQAAGHAALWKRFPPDVVIAADEYSLGTHLATASSAHGIPSVDVAHSLQGPSQRNYAFSAQALFGPDNVRSHVAALSPPPSCELVPVGACRFDDIHDRRYPDASVIRSVLGVSDGVPLVAVASQYNWDRAGYVRSLKAKMIDWCARGLPEGAVLVVKLHPLESDTDIERRLADLLPHDRFRVVRDVDLYGLLATSDALVTLWSTAGCEAILLGKPLILVDNPEIAHMPYGVHGVGCVVRDASGMRSALATAVGDGLAIVTRESPARQAMIEGSLFAADGGACARLAAVVGRYATDHWRGAWVQ